MNQDATQDAAAEHREWLPSGNPWMIAASVMAATFMTVLSTSIANVALPHIAGDLSASTDESTWVLTSYLVANAIMIPAAGWIARRIGRRRLLMLSIALFTGASLLCGMAINLPMLVIARILQGMGGGGMQPLAQAILLESFPRRLQATAMAVYGTGVVVAPVLGPTLGGWVTDSYSWRWIFYINIPVGIVAILMARMFIEDPPYLRHAVRGAIDYRGFAMMAVWLATMQVVLDKGQDADWFGATWIRWFTAVSAIAFIGFVVRELTCREPIVQLRVLADPNFRLGTLINVIYGFALYGTTALLPLFLQTLMGYTAWNSGLAVGPRGLGIIMAMILVGVIVNSVDARLLMISGFGLLAYSIFLLSHINLGISMAAVVVPNIMNGFATGLIFVPLTTLTLGHLRKEEMGNATGIYNLMRNLGGGIGISTVTAFLQRGAQTHQTYLAANVTPGNPAVMAVLRGLQAKFSIGGASAYTAHQEALGAVYRSIRQQASLLAYADNFRTLGYLALICASLAMFFQRARRH
jgi:DHA2 family multidrug resistance protein